MNHSYINTKLDTGNRVDKTISLSLLHNYGVFSFRHDDDGDNIEARYSNLPFS